MDKFFYFSAVKETLEQEGVLRKIKAQVQSEVTKMLFESVPSSPQRPGLPQDLVLINELVKQYLEWIGYSYTLPIFNIGKEIILTNLLLFR